MDKWIDVTAHPFYAKGDGVTDDTKALNNAFAVGANLSQPVWIPPGTYIVSDTLWPVPEGSSFESCRIEGAGAGYAAVQRTVIDASRIVNGQDMKQKPVFNFQRVRGSSLKGVYILGPNSVPAAANDALLDYDYAWIGSGVRTAQHSPQCAIAVDAGVGYPADQYPGMEYVSPSGRGGGSYFIVFEDVVVESHCVGFMIGPDTTANGSDIRWYDCRIRNCREGIAVGHSQARGLNFYGGGINLVRTAFDGRRYGNQQGAPVVFHGTQFGPAFQLFDFSSTFGQINFVGIRSEQLHRLGFAGVNSASGFPIGFYGCDLRFLNVNDSGQTTNLILEAEAQPVIFSGCSILYNGIVVPAALDTVNLPPPAGLWMVASMCTFDTCQLLLANQLEPFVGNIGNDGTNGKSIIRNTRVRDGGGGHQRVGVEGREISAPSRIVEHPDGPHALLHYGSEDYLYKKNASLLYVSAGSNGANYTFTEVTPGVYDLNFTLVNAPNSLIMIGDYLAWQMKPVGIDPPLPPQPPQPPLPIPPQPQLPRIGPTLRVRQINGATVTCRLLSPLKYYDTSYQPNPLSILVRRWAPGVTLTATRSPVIPNQVTVNVSGVLQVGDWVQAATQLSAGTRVIAVAGATITLSKPTLPGAPTFTIFFDRLHTLNTTVAF